MASTSIPNGVEGDLDAVARALRRRNAAAVVDAAVWADARSPTGEYVVAPGVQLELRAAPHARAPRTGYSLAPGGKFATSRERADADGEVWLRVSAPPSEGETVDAGPPINTDEGETAREARRRAARLERGAAPIRAPPAPQGWLRVRPGGAGTAAVVARTDSALRCCACGDGLVTPFDNDARDAWRNPVKAP